MTVFTIGHSTRSLPEFLALLAEHRLQRLVDVRRYPGSSRFPHFSRHVLEPALANAGVAYVHEPDLGGRRAPRPDSPNGAWRSASFRAYADHMESRPWQEALGRVLDAGGASRTVLMCAEAVPWRCHRQLIADALVARGVAVCHIIGAGPPAPHALHPAARLFPGNVLRYPPADAPQPDLFRDRDGLL